MQTIELRHELSERRHALEERRSFCDRARADRLVGLWAAGHLGLRDGDAETYADEVVRAGVKAPGGRGGFDRIAADLAATPIHVEAIRSRYAIVMADIDRPHAPVGMQGFSLGF
ncbi:ATPase inhibitor subunit zeta [Aureimonas sp. SK2]|uniref:ATPase inhibitor subunit zeta n=1 Tax=Aureimonas sp. SK2 TaxID=3015992 RepID=UPI002443E898|nr:ATPase inhibitor subunit zeta [Aureimonas sp. SK2]